MFWEEAARVSRRIVSFGGGSVELFLKQGLFSGGTLGCGSNLGGTHSGEREIKRSGRPREVDVCVYVYII